MNDEKKSGERVCTCCGRSPAWRTESVCGWCLAQMTHGCTGCLSARMNRHGRA